MGISKQIGWSPEANLYYQISQQLERLISVTSKVVLTPPVPAYPNLTLMIDNSPNFDIPEYLGVGVNPSDYTIEWWSYMDADDNHPRAWSIGSFPNAAHAVSIESGIIYYWINGAIASSATLPQPYIGQWSYFTVARRKDGIGIWQNGISLTNDAIYSGAIPTNGLPLYLGSEGNDSIFKGKITNFRWSNENLYGIIPNLDFTPPTSPLTVLASTKLLIFQGTDISAQITDQSASGYTITNASGLYRPENPFAGVQGSTDFGFVLGFTFKVDNSAGNAGGGSGAQYAGSGNMEMIVDWGDGSALRYYYNNTPQELTYTYASNGIFDVTVYVRDLTSINYIDSTVDKGVFYMLEVDYSKLVNISFAVLHGNQLPSTQVNKLLSELVANGLFSGTLDVSTQTPPAPPTGQGLIDKDELIARGWTVTTD